MKILKVIHGYPPRYSAGSEVYSQILAHGLADNHEVQVFSRCESSFLPDYHYITELDPLDSRILVHIVNVPRAKYRDQYVHAPVDEKFKEILRTYKPDIIHFGHLSHLSLNLPQIAKDLGIPTTFTLHDFWLMCARGQFIQRNSKEPWELCDGQEDSKCAKKCYVGSFSGQESNYQQDLNYWTDWIHNRMAKTRSAMGCIDHFIAPSKFLMNKFIEDFDLPGSKVTFLDYGFNLERLTGRTRVKEKQFVFGYIGTHTPQKGIHHLIEAFSKLEGSPVLRIWGTPKDDTAALKVQASSYSQNVANRIEWKGGYDNSKIIERVFNHLDAIVVPSIWGENSPLVIHEAQQARVPVITANYGGMSEYVAHMKNGLLFEHRNSLDLATKMQKLVDQPEVAIKLGKYGYLYSEDRQIPNIVDHVKDVERIYINLTNKASHSKPGPWRITFDTNPDHCNYQCVMCECFSPFSKVKDERKANNKGKQLMPIEMIEKILAESVGTPLREIIPSTMGEPLLYKDFDRIIELCHKYNLKLNLTTNGSFPVKGVERWAELLVPILSDVKISWNGATKQTHEKIMQGSKWEEVLSNLQAFIRKRDNYAQSGAGQCSITLQLTFLEDNVSELVDIVKLAIKLGVDRVKGHHLWAHFDEIKDQSMRRNKEAIQRWNSAVKNVFEVVKNNKLPNDKDLILENITLLDENAVEDLAPGGLCPFLGKEAWVNTAGKFSPCCAPDNLRKSLGDFGNLNETTIEDIWSSKEYNDLRKNYLTKDLCKSCNMRKPFAA